FQNVYDAQRVEPYPTYYRMKNSLNPVLVSAELWGRHFYPGEKLPTRFCVVNDKVDGKVLEPATLKWEITHKDNRVVSSGSYEIPEVEHYGRYWMNPEIVIPGNFNQGRLDGKLRLFLIQHGETLAQNEYDLMVAKPDWVKKDYNSAKDIVLVDYTGETNRLINRLNINVKEAGALDEAFRQKADLYIVSGISQNNLSAIEKQLIRDKFEGGNNILLLNTGSQIMEIFPDYVSGYLDKTLETAHIDIPESEVFNGLEYMDLRYFNNNKLEKPLVYNGLMQVYKKSSVKSLVSGCEHRYARKADRRSEMLTMKGFPVISIDDGGRVILSEMLTSKGIHDPVAGKLLMNMIQIF
ncbi:MAG: hypothetical protein K9G70_09895, partial [Prolixibacteraceae bacterium]|nr:hypothetical protein [Prolixibacteraceae bacterium]